ncbi:MAG: hypothetical protein ACM3SU_09395, partial [Acidobacteriota bacterium]
GAAEPGLPLRAPRRGGGFGTVTSFEFRLRELRQEARRRKFLAIDEVDDGLLRHERPLKMGDREIPASGKKIELRACQVIEVANDKVKSMRHYFDIGTLLKQIGAGH